MVFPFLLLSKKRQVGIPSHLVFLPLPHPHPTPNLPLGPPLLYYHLPLQREGDWESRVHRRLIEEAEKMGLLSVDLLITLQILPVFFSNCLFLALYDSVILLKHVALLLSRSKSTRGEWRRMLTSEGLRCVWNSFLLDAYKQVSCIHRAPRSQGQGSGRGGAADHGESYLGWPLQ